MFYIDFNCNLRDLKSKVNKAPQAEVLRMYVLGWIDKCLKDGIPKNKQEARAIKGVSKEKKKKRAPSKYNIFIGGCMKGCGKETEPCTDRMKSCAIKWKQEKK